MQAATVSKERPAGSRIAILCQLPLSPKLNAERLEQFVGTIRRL